jgi:hypothetical protein
LYFAGVDTFVASHVSRTVQHDVLWFHQRILADNKVTVTAYDVNGRLLFQMKGIRGGRFDVKGDERDPVYLSMETWALVKQQIEENVAFVDDSKASTTTTEVVQYDCSNDIKLCHEVVSASLARSTSYQSSLIFGNDEVAGLVRSTLVEEGLGGRVRASGLINGSCMPTSDTLVGAAVVSSAVTMSEKRWMMPSLKRDMSAASLSTAIGLTRQLEVVSAQKNDQGVCMMVPPLSYSIRLKQRGSLLGLEVEEEPSEYLSTKTSAEILEKDDSALLFVLRVRAVGLNFRDVLNVLGMYPGDPGQPGADCAGDVEVVSETATTESGFAHGTRVFGVGSGSLSLYVEAHRALIYI